MRLALLTFDFPPTVGGVQQYLWEIARRLTREHEVVVVTPVPGPPADGPFTRRMIPSTHPLAFLRALADIRPDWVIVGHVHPRMVIPAMMWAPGRWAAIAYGNDVLALQRRWHRPIVHSLLRRARPLIAISQATARRMRQWGVPPAVIVRPGVDPDRFTPPSSPPPPPWKLLTVARLVSRKGIDTVLAAIARLRAHFPDLQYYIVGEGPDRERLGQLVVQYQLQGCVHFMGYVSDEALPSLYRKAHIFVMTPREEPESVEGFGSVYLEASASGLPVVAARSGGASEAVIPEQTGLLVPPDDPDALAQALQRLLANPTLRQTLGARGRQWVEREMNWERAAREMQRALEQVWS